MFAQRLSKTKTITHFPTAPAPILINPPRVHCLSCPAFLGCLARIVPLPPSKSLRLLGRTKISLHFIANRLQFRGRRKINRRLLQFSRRMFTLLCLHIPPFSPVHRRRSVFSRKWPRTNDKREISKPSVQHDMAFVNTELLMDKLIGQAYYYFNRSRHRCDTCNQM